MTVSSRADGHFRRAFLFLFVGGIGFVVDAGLYNLLVFLGGRGPLSELPLLAKIIAILGATVVTYVGNRSLTYRDRRVPPTFRQLLLFSALNVVAILLQLACLGFSRYVLGLSDPIADNISGTLIGQALATVFRYFTYSRFVFPTQDSPAK